MSVINLKIEEIGADGELGDITNYVFNSPSGSNISNTSYKVNIYGQFELDDVKQVSGSNGLSMASDDGSNDLDLVFDDDDNLSSYAVSGSSVEDEEDPVEFIWGIVPSNGEYTVKLTFTNAETLRSVTVVGDSEVNQFPTKAIIDGVSHLSNSSISWDIKFNDENDTHTLEFTKWNKINYNACLTSIAPTLGYLELGKEHLSGFSSITQLTTNPSGINFGMVANSGNTEINDIDGEIKEYISDGKIESSNVKVEVFVNGNKIQTHLTSDSEYIEQDRALSLQLTNDISKMNDVVVNFPTYHISGGGESLKTILTQCFTNIGYVSGVDYSLGNTIFLEQADNGYSLVEVTVSNYLDRFEIKYPYFVNLSLSNIIKSVCEIAQLNCFKDENNRIMFVPANPIRSSTDTEFIHIPRYAQIQDPERSLFIKNKYDNVSYKTRKITKSYSVAFEKEYNIFDEETLQWHTNELGENSRIYWEGNIMYVCFFVTINTSENELNDYNVAYDRDGIHAWSYMITSTNEIGHGGDRTLYSQTDLDVSEINWSSLSGGAVYRMLKYETATNAIFAVKLKFDGATDSGAPKKVSLTLRSKKYSVTTSDTKTMNNLSRVFELPYNTLFSEDNTYTYRNGSVINMYDYCKNNIIRYYRDGVQTLKLRVFAMDYYAYGLNSKYKVIDFTNKGEIFKLNQNIVVDEDNSGNSMFKYKDGTDIVWRITSINFDYDNASYIDLELQESKYYGI